MGNVGMEIQTMTNSKPSYLELQSFQCLLTLALLCLMSCTPTVRNVGDVAHCCARVGTGIGKRLKDTARTWSWLGAPKAVSNSISNL